MRFWIPGTGVLGRQVAIAAGKVGQCFMSDRRAVDIGDEAAVNRAMRSFQPEVVINCAGIVKGRDLPDSEYIRVNALGPHILAEACDRWKAQLIHVSTDCVFSGKPPNTHSEMDCPDPNDIYGYSKLAGEITRSPHLTVRTSFIGVGERGLLAWLMRQKGEVAGYADSWWNGLTAPVLGSILVGLAGQPKAQGLIHLGGECITKYDLLQRLAKALHLPIHIKETMAPPAYSVCRCLRTTYDWVRPNAIPSMDAQIAILAKSMEPRKKEAMPCLS